jgi:uncharacterized protein (TIGR00251 family)
VEGPTTTRLRLRVSPGASKSEVVGSHGEAWKVRVTAAPESGKANEAVRDLLATTLGIPRSSTEIISGAASRDKVVVVRGLTAEEAEARLGGTS